jgi:hypothetical protein
MKMKNLNNKLLLLTFLLFIICNGCHCKKDNPTPSNTNTTTNNSTSTWKVGTNSYSSSTAAKVNFGGNSALSISDGTNNSAIAIYFPAFPTANTNYKVAKYNTSGAISINLGSTQVSVDATINNGDDDYLSTGSGNVTATVTVDNNGKLTVTLPSFWARHNTSNGQQPDSLQVSGTIVEN